MTKTTGKLPPRRYWTEAETELLRHHYADSLTRDLAKVLGMTEDRVLRKAHDMGLHKNVEIIRQMARERSSDPHHGGRLHRFQPGQAPANKGKKMPKGWAPGNMAATQFKVGLRPHTWVPIGSYTINPDGYLDRKVSDEPGTPRHVRWHPVHRLVWEHAHGPVPRGHVVVFRPGRFTNVLAKITLDRLELVSRAELMKRNSVHRLPPEMLPIVRLRASLTREINQQTKEATNG